MKALILVFILSGFFVANAQNSNEFTVKVQRSERALFFPSTQAEKNILFEISGINASEIPLITQKAKEFEGVIDFSIENTSNLSVFKAKGVFIPDNQYDFFKDFFNHIGVKKLNIEDLEILPSQAITFTSEQFDQLDKLNYQISQIETKIKWTNLNQDQLARENGWYTDAYNNLALAKQAKQAYLDSIK